MPEASGPVRLVVLYGGQSAEHDVSRLSAAHVLRAVDPSRYEIDPIAITPDGAWLRSEATLRALADGPHALPDVLDASGTAVVPQADLAPARADQTVVVLPVLHGPRGEDGAVQGLLELVGVPYVGCGVLGSAVCMDKGVAKDLAAAAGIPQVRHLTVRDREVDADVAKQVEAELGWPVFVKPANMGSSVGVSRAGDADELAAALAEAARFDELSLIHI